MVNLPLVAVPGALNAINAKSRGISKQLVHDTRIVSLVKKNNFTASSQVKNTL